MILMHNTTRMIGVATSESSMLSSEGPGMRLERAHRSIDRRRTQQRQQHVERQRHQRQRPGPTQPGSKCQRASVAQTAFDPRVQRLGIRPMPQAYTLHGTVYLCGRIAPDHACDGYQVASHIGVWSKFDVAQHRHHIAANDAVYIDIAQHSDRALAHRTGDACVAQHRDHRMRHIPGAGGGAQHGDHVIGMLTGGKRRVGHDVDEVIFLVAVFAVVAVVVLIVTPGI